MPSTKAKRLRDRLERIAENPTTPQIDVKLLVGVSNIFRVRQGDWRATYSLDGGDVIVDQVGSRKEIYR